MKKLVSLLIALVLVVSMLATTVAFAEENEEENTEPARAEVVYNSDAFWALEEIKKIPRLHANTKEFKVDDSWVKDSAKLSAVFSNINYVLKDATADGYTVTDDSDKIFFEYCSPSKDYKEKWTAQSLGSNIPVSSSGWWSFRYVVKDKSGSSVSEDYLARSERIDVYFGDETQPVIKNLSTDMKNIQDSGIAVGSTYTIKTNLSIDDDSSTTVSYVVYKKVGTDWVKVLDSAEKTVAEGYEDGITTAGVITMLEDDVLADNAPIYKIEYSVTDAVGYKSEQPIELLLHATKVEKEPEKMSKTQIWTIVLYVIAGLAFVGIIVVLFIKPKKPATTVGARSEESTDSKE